MNNIQDDNGGSETFAQTFPIERRSASLLWLVWIAWLPLFIPTLVGFFQSHQPLPRFIATLVGVTLFFGIYLWASWHYARQLVVAQLPPRQTPPAVWLPLIMLIVLSIVLVLGNGPGWLALFYFTSGYVGGRLPIAQATRAIAGLTLLVAAVALLTHAGWFVIAQAMLFVCVIGGVIISMMRAIMTTWELRAARDEIARLAVMTERLRIARDLHDLLGHNLSLIALKSELAGRLISVAPAQAAVEIGDVEQVARSTLQEVREAVGGYRQPTLASELHGAQEILAAAGIAYRYEGDEHMLDGLPSPVEAVLAWTVREGVTNVIRHSRAHRCTIRLLRDRDTAGVEVIDDGVGVPATLTGSANAGNGLHGLAERVTALGGHYQSGAHTGGGFHLTVSVPLLQLSYDRATPAVFAASEQQHMPASSLENSLSYAKKDGQL